MKPKYWTFIWDNGAFISSRVEDFGDKFVMLLDQFGPPDTVKPSEQESNNV